MPGKRTSEAPSAFVSMPAGPRWYIVRTIRHRENQALEAIAQIDGIETYLPQECHFAKHGRKLCRVVAPLFRQYLFTRFDLDRHDWWKIRSSHYVDYIICDADEIPLRVPDYQIEIIHNAELAGEYDFTKRPGRRQFDPLQPGAKVRITAGPFVGLLAEIRRASPRRRVEILFQILGRETRIRIDRLNLQRV